MISLRRLRLVDWHYFNDVVIPIGEATLLVGDNGSGKSTIIDAIQYALAANLNRIRFNAAADKRAGRTLEGYVRAKTGLESGEYLRDDAVGHVMLEFDTPQGVFSAGICIEAFKEENQVKEYPWIGEKLSLRDIRVRDGEDRILLGRAFRELLRSAGAVVFESKKDYSRELTHRLGVFRRNAEFNPYLEALVRSVGFTPLTSVDRFVCDYILEERPVDISAMKANLESYKEAEAEATITIQKINALTTVCNHAAEWRQVDKQILLQDYLRVRASKELTEERKRSLEIAMQRDREELERLKGRIEQQRQDRLNLERERRDAETAMSRNDAYILVRNLKDRQEQVLAQLKRITDQYDRYRLLREQCEALLGTRLGKRGQGLVIDEELEKIEGEQQDLSRALAEHRQKLQELDSTIADYAGELADLERGLPRYPTATRGLKDALDKAGIQSWIFADLVEVADVEWQNAVEGWLNTLRFAVLVEPDRFFEALRVYDRLPRDIAGVPLPNLKKMENFRVHSGSLAELLVTDSPYARTYTDFILGDVIRATVDTLKDFEKSVTKECMTYSRYTANRMKEETYSRWYLGRSARERRIEELRRELKDLRTERNSLDGTITSLVQREEVLRRVYKTLNEMRPLQGAEEEISRLKEELAKLEKDIRQIDLSGVRELELRIATLSKTLGDLENRIQADMERLGRLEQTLEDRTREGLTLEDTLEQARSAFDSFLQGREYLEADCIAYYEERRRETDLTTLLENYEGALKGYHTRLERITIAYQKAIQEYNHNFNAMLPLDIQEASQAEALKKRFEDSELPVYREKISRARMEAEKQFKEHFVARLNEYIEDGRESFREINETLKTLSFGRDQYRFTLEEKPERRSQLEVIRKAAEINVMEDGLFSALVDPEERRIVEGLFEKIIRNELNSNEVRDLCDYRTYFTYDIKMRDTSAIDPKTGKPPELSLSKVIREKSGGEAQTPYYVAIAAGFYRFYKDDIENCIRLVLFDEAFNRMDDERIGVALDFFRRLNMQIVTAVPTEKLETLASHMDSISLVVRHGYHAMVRDFKLLPSSRIESEKLLVEEVET